ncbi:MAG: hypothetical protein HC898_11945 [Phycisphaerales bacterium]|nr:hypothetical protein [Phycisphaerales bacterium]
MIGTPDSTDYCSLAATKCPWALWIGLAQACQNAQRPVLDGRQTPAGGRTLMRPGAGVREQKSKGCKLHVLWDANDDANCLYEMAGRKRLVKTT